MVALASYDPINAAIHPTALVAAPNVDDNPFAGPPRLADMPATSSDGWVLGPLPKHTSPPSPALDLELILRTIALQLAIGVVPPAAVFLLGWGVLWAVQGFTKRELTAVVRPVGLEGEREFELETVIRRPVARRVGSAGTGIKAVAAYVTDPCPRCGGRRFDSSPAFRVMAKAEGWTVPSQSD
jgi:hypothetical protein